MDKIILKGMQFYGYHGLFSEERKLGQRFHVDVDVYTSLKETGLTDRMEASIHYGDTYEKIRDIVEGIPYNLIEAVAESVAHRLLTDLDTLASCTVKVIKPDPPIPGHYESVAVEIHRERT